METFIRDVLKVKGREVHTIEADRTVYEAVEAMERLRVGALMVVSGDRVRGIITERDYLRKVVLKGRTSKTTTVNEIASLELIAVDEGFTVEDAMSIMTERRIRHLPVMDREELVGLVSVGDLVKQICRDRRAQVHFLSDYVAGKYPA